MFNSRFSIRLLEISSGLISWALLTSPFWASFLIPEVVAYFIILFDFYFFYKASSLSFNSVRSYLKIKRTGFTNWVEKMDQENLDYSKIRHLVFIPTYKEPKEILERTLTFLAAQEFPAKQLDVVLAMEDRDNSAPEKVEALKKAFSTHFGNFWVTSHTLSPGEVIGKSSNLAFSAQRVRSLIEEAGYDKNFLTVTSCDADVAFHPKYFSNLTYQFLTDAERHFHFWQAALVFYNNIWRVPIFVRVVHTIYSISGIAELMRPKSNFNYSSYSLSWKLLEETGFWDVDVVAEDWHLFFKAFFSHQGKVELESIFLPLYADAVEGQNYWQSAVAQYTQNRRWAWGVTDIAYAVRQFWSKRREIPVGNFVFRFVAALQQHLLWPVTWWILTLGATIPPLINEQFAHTALGFYLPKVSGLILTTTTVFIISVIIIDWQLRPPKPADYKNRFLLFNLLQYLLLPITGFFFGSLPGMDAHTRLIFGKRIEYKATEKFVEKN
ncbi:MAG: glycosyltransferase family 2 protein [bacterium]|nr:glycosyltransferase family 2 protein [bacterium]